MLTPIAGCKHLLSWFEDWPYNSWRLYIRQSQPSLMWSFIQELSFRRLFWNTTMIVWCCYMSICYMRHEAASHPPFTAMSPQIYKEKTKGQRKREKNLWFCSLYDIQKRSLWVPVSTSISSNTTSSWRHISNQSGSRWHSQHPEYWPDSLCGLYSGGKLPFSWSMSNASVKTLISRPLLTHFLKERLNCPVYITSYIELLSENLGD